jgi:putative SOS response-associated peptidase YedK
MCFHYSITQQKIKIAATLQVNWEGEEWQPVYHAAGFSFLQMPVVTQEKPTDVQLFHWGLIPHWVKSKEDADKLKAQTLNARSETVFEKPSFRNSIKSQRCLVPADGFFEWMDFNKKKYPHYIFMKDASVFCFAGIASSWTDKETGEVISTFSILTTEANPMMARIHNLKKRMPVIIPAAMHQTWLQQNLSPEAISAFLKPYSETEMDSYTISKRITSRTENSNAPETLEPFVYDELG